MMGWGVIRSFIYFIFLCYFYFFKFDDFLLYFRDIFVWLCVLNSNHLYFVFGSLHFFYNKKTDLVMIFSYFSFFFPLLISSIATSVSVIYYHGYYYDYKPDRLD